jgi:tetratricopeptide (TPR) repeat protein
MHERVQAASGGTAPIDVGLTDLPVAGEPARAAARAARAQRNGGAMAVTLDIEAALDAEARGQGAVALQAFLRALGRDPSDIEALEGVRRLATAGGDRLGAARAALRLGAVLRVPARAAAAFLEAAEALEALGQIGDAVIACWRALERLPDSEVIYQRLHGLLMEAGDPAGLDRLYGRRLAAVAEPDAQVAVLLERAEHRRERLQDRKAAVEDFKRILKIDPGHPAALRRLATLAEQMEYFPQAARFLERLLAVETDGDRAALLRLELAGVWDAAREPVRARDVLRKAAAARPLDSAPWQRLTDLALRLGDWSGALDALRSWERLASDPQVRAGLWVRIGGLLRDHARDAAKAAAAFANAATLDPLGEGVHALVELHERNGATAARRQVLDNAIADLQVELGTDPVDVPRLERLRELIALAGAGRDDAQAGLFREADAAVGQVLALLGEAPAAGPPPGRRRTFASPPSPDFWGRIWPPDAGGLAAQIWPLLASAAAELHPQSQLARPRAAIRVPPGTDRRFSWIEAAATALGLPTLSLYFLESSTDVAPIVIDTGEPTLVVGLATLAGDATARFWVGRALALLRERAVLLEPLPATEVGALLAAAAAVAGVSPPVAAGALRAVEERARALARAMGRKERKALALQASRFTSERIDAAAFREAMLAGADRLGLVMAGDVAAAVRAVAGPAAAAARTARSAVAGDARALALVRFALTDDYLLLRNAGDGGDGGGWG